jgi:hypothetical protein
MSPLAMVPSQQVAPAPVRFSRLKLIARSPLHYAHATVEETSAMERGSAVHSLVLGGEEVLSWEEGRPRRGKDFDAFEAQHPGALILTAKEFDKANAIAKAVKENPLAMAALSGPHEQERAWRFGDRPCAGRMDAIPFDGVTELKVSQTADPKRFIWHALRMGWLAQGVWYLDGLAAGGQILRHVRIVAVEPTAPYAVTVFKLTAKAMDQARRTYRGWFEHLMACEASDEWPPYAQGEVDLDVPDDEPELDWGDAEEAA